METAKALHIIRSLADGVDPATGEAIAADTVYQRPDTVRALFAAIQALEGAEKERISQSSLAAGSLKPWERDEDRLLYTGFSSGATVAELARQHGRPEEAIRARLEKLGYLIAEAAREGAGQEMSAEPAGMEGLFVFKKPAMPN